MNIKPKLCKSFETSLEELKYYYGENFEKLNGLCESQLDDSVFIDNFIDSDNPANCSIDGSANVGHKDICCMKSEMSKSRQKLLAFNKIFYEIEKKYGKDKADMWLLEEWNGGFYLHNSYMSTYLPYCYSYDLEDLMNKGLYFIDNFGGKPAKHLSTFIDHTKEFVSWVSNRSTGACGLTTFLVHAYYFWYTDVKNKYYTINPEYYRDQCFQELIFGLNHPGQRINQSSFTNFSILDRNYLAELFGDRKYPDGKYVIDCIEEIIEFQKSFMRVISKTRQEHMFTFPVLTYSLLFQNDKFVDEKFARWCSDHNCQWNDSNFFNGEDVTVLSQCCRLLSDTSKVNNKANGFINSIGGSSLKIGSVAVNTINLMKIAYQTSSREEYFNKLKEKVELCIIVLDVIRGIIKRNIEKGLLPNYSYKLIEMDYQFNTIGVIAMYEVINHFGFIKTDIFGNKSYTDDGIQLASEILDFINKIKDSYEFDYNINLEAIPGERAAVILCEKDNILYKNNNDYFMYANQWIPLVEKCTIDEKIKLGSILDKKCGGGQITSINLDGRFSDKEQAWDLLNYIAKKGVIYFAFNNKINVCEDNHGFYGNICDVCGKEVIDTYQRIVGYLAPTRTYSKERKKEFYKRYWYNLNEM